jgi:DNA polymerase III delta prime subunit
MNNLHPAYLFIGTETSCHDAVNTYLRSILCKKNGCLNCINCQQITSQQHSSIMWIQPENRYTLDDFDELFKKVSFTLEETADFFFIIEQAHLLSAACANALLKIVEEPPQGYHFIFTAHHLQSIIPTIRSRCIIKTIHTAQKTKLENIHAKFFIQKNDPNAFLLYISKTTITESEIVDLIDFLITYYSSELLKKTGNCSADEWNFLQHFLQFLQQTRQNPIMPGSGKLFLKELYLHKDALEQRYALT